MQRYTIQDVMDDSFDLSSLVISNEELSNLTATFSRVKSSLESLKRQQASNSQGRYIYVNDSEILESQTALTTEHYLCMAFSSTALHNVSKALSGNRWLSWQLTKSVVRWVGSNSSIAKKVLMNTRSDDSIRIGIINRGYLQIEDLLSLLQCGLATSLPQGVQSRILEVCDPSDAKHLIKSDFDKIKLNAYIKSGPLNYLDDMIRDSHVMIRRYAISLLSPGDARLALFINDRSQDVFCQALSKISPTLIPMMLGSSHLKKKRAKEVLNNRLAQQNS